MRSQGRRTKDKNNPCSRGPLLLIVLVIIAGFMAVNLAGLHAAKESFKGSRTTGDVQLGLPLSLSAPQLPVEELCCSYRDIFSTSCSCKDSQCPLKSIDRLCIMALQEQRAIKLIATTGTNAASLSDYLENGGGTTDLSGGSIKRNTRAGHILTWVSTRPEVGFVLEIGGSAFGDERGDSTIILGEVKKRQNQQLQQQHERQNQTSSQVPQRFKAFQAWSLESNPAYYLRGRQWLSRHTGRSRLPIRLLFTASMDSRQAAVAAPTSAADDRTLEVLRAVCASKPFSLIVMRGTGGGSLGTSEWETVLTHCRRVPFVVLDGTHSKYLAPLLDAAAHPLEWEVVYEEVTAFGGYQMLLDGGYDFSEGTHVEGQGWWRASNGAMGAELRRHLDSVGGNNSPQNFRNVAVLRNLRGCSLPQTHLLSASEQRELAALEREAGADKALQARRGGFDFNRRLRNFYLPPASVAVTSADARATTLRNMYVDRASQLVMCLVEKVASSELKKLLYRMLGDALWRDDPWFKTGLPQLLHEKNEAAVHAIINSPAWTKAVFLRHPYSRLISAYRDKFGRGDTSYSIRMTGNRSAQVLPFEQFVDFVTAPGSSHRNVHWSPQSSFCAMQKYIGTFNFVGNFERLRNHSRVLLEGIDAWDVWGASGWGQFHNQSIFERNFAKHRTTTWEAEADQKGGKLAWAWSWALEQQEFDKMLPPGSAVRRKAFAYYREDFEMLASITTPPFDNSRYRADLAAELAAADSSAGPVIIWPPQTYTKPQLHCARREGG
jgi:hypothetical protein